MELSEKCPSNELLSSLLAGELEPAAVQETLVHLDTCTVCQRRLEEIGGCDERLLQMLNEIGGVKSSSSALQLALCKLKGKTTSPPTDPILPFMNPPNSSGCLGQIGPYEILDVIGQGGMGIVLKARDASLNRFDAIKVLTPRHASNANARRRFLREARAAAAISHENVVTVFAVDEFRSYPFLVMEYVCGCSLEDRMRGPLNCQEVLCVGAQIAAGLAAAHACGVIHRDIKPANILLRADDGRVKITDFGLACVADGMHVTQSGLIAGTPAYMSPEQTRGQLLDGRSDLFSLGCVLHAMVTGRSPFQAKTVIDTIRRVCDETPPSVRQFNADIPDRLAAIIERLMTKDPDTLPEAHKSMGFVLACCDHDWSRAEQHFRRALELDPRSAGARLAYALSVLVPRGRFAEALGETKRARDLDPVTPMIVAGPGVVQTYNRQYNHAIDAFSEALELEPLNPVVNLWSAIAWLGKGEFAQALAVIEIARPFQLLAKETEAVIHASAGSCNRAEELLAELRNDVECGCREATLSVGRVYAAIGRKHIALDWLERAVQQRIVATILLAVDPCYDELRGERRFGDFLRQLDLED